MERPLQVFCTRPFRSSTHRSLRKSTCACQRVCYTSPGMYHRPNHSEHRQHHSWAISWRGAQYKQYVTGCERHHHQQQFSWSPSDLRGLGWIIVFLCLLNNPSIVSYTIRYGRASDADTAYQFVTEDYSPYRAVPAPVYQAQQSVGPTNRTLEDPTGCIQFGPFVSQRRNRSQQMAGTLAGPENGAYQFHLSAGTWRRGLYCVSDPGLRCQRQPVGRRPHHALHRQ